jgi:hypothetical protein
LLWPVRRNENRKVEEMVQRQSGGVQPIRALVQRALKSLNEQPIR